MNTVSNKEAGKRGGGEERRVDIKGKQKLSFLFHVRTIIVSHNIRKSFQNVHLDFFLNFGHPSSVYVLQ